VGFALTLGVGCRTPVDDWGDRPVMLAPARPKPRPFDGASVERGLMALAPAREAAAAAHADARAWPPELRVSWLKLLGLLEEELAWGADPPDRLLLQARVITDAEREAAVRRFGEPPPEVDVRLGRIYARVRHHLERRRPNPSAPRLGWPVAPVVVSSPFGRRRDPVHGEVRMHKGLDLAGRHGDVVSAAAAGTVTTAGWMGGFGLAVTIVHADGVETLYGHLGRVLVREGELVDDGQAVGLMGSSGRSTGPHLHFEVWRGGEPVDPIGMVEPWRLAAVTHADEATGDEPLDAEGSGDAPR
jgi:murein DD-endopeptidase MepM/ murein hydrolase activator NlpD